MLGEVWQSFLGLSFLGKTVVLFLGFLILRTIMIGIQARLGINEPEFEEGEDTAASFFLLPILLTMFGLHMLDKRVRHEMKNSLSMITGGQTEKFDTQKAADDFP